jgi:hypothetical protein
MPRNRDLLLQMLSGGVEKGISAGSAGALKSMERQGDLEKLLKGDELKAQGLEREISAAKRMSREHPGVAVKAGEASIGAPERMGRAGIAQQRLEASGLNRLYTDQTKPIKEKQQTLQDIAPLLQDPTNIDDQQLRRTMAMAVNKGALSDTDVDDSLPGDVEQTLKKAYNWVQPALSPLGFKKKPIYSEETVKNINKLVTGKLAPLDSQLEEAGRQVEELAPAFAPTLSEDPELLQQTITGIRGPRQAQQKRINEGIKGAGKTKMSFDEWKKAKKEGKL